MNLPGTINERVRILRTSKGYSQRELAEIIAIAPSQLSRIEKGQTRHISSDILVKLAEAFRVSSDYLLGLPVSCGLGFSERAVTALATKAADAAFLSLFLEHDSFPYLLQLIKAYKACQEDTGDSSRRSPDRKADSLPDARITRSKKTGDHAAELEKITSAFLAIMQDIGKEIDER